MDARVIFVDDEPLFLEGLRRTLRVQLADVTVQVCTSGMEALALLSSGSPTVVVCDWDMEAIDGPTFCELVRAEQREDTLRPYILMLTGRSGAEQAAEALERGADDFVSKPVNARELHARIRVGLRLAAAEHQLRLANRQLEQGAAADPVTGLACRAAGQQLLRSEFSRIAHGHHDGALLLVGVVRWKDLIDVYGHAAADAVMRAVASRVGGCCRSYDTVIRWSEEQILIAAPHVCAADLDELSERVLGSVAAAPVQLDAEVSVDVSASLGIVWVRSGVPDALDRALDAVQCALAEARRAECGVQTRAIRE
jgi:diguanylate cyclase (GGDEF)-like protein